MRTDEFFEALGELDDSLIINARNTPDNPVKINVEKRSWKPFAAMAACFAALIVVAALNFGKIVEYVKDKNNNDGYPKDAIYQYTGDFTELKPVYYLEVDYFYKADLNGLVESSDAVVVGTFVDNARQNEPLNGEIKCDLITYSEFGMSYNKLCVDRVIKGNVAVGDELIIGDQYFVNGSDLNYYPGKTYTPMIKGDSWVYFLTRDDNGYYAALGHGRYPVPGEEHPFVLAPRWHGAYDHYDFSDEIYEDVKIMLGYIDGVQKLDLGDNMGKFEFTMPDFLGDRFVWRGDEVYELNGKSENARTIYAAPGIMSIYFADLNGDSKREMVFECWNGASGLSASYIIVYDHANSKLYSFGQGVPKGEILFSDRLEIRDNVLYAVRESLGTFDELYAAPLMFDNLTEMTDTEPETVEYKGKTYFISNKIVHSDVDVNVGTTQLEYQAGDLIEVLAMVKNNTNKPIKLRMPSTAVNSEVNVTITQEKTALINLSEGGGDAVITYHTVKPGETYYQPMQFDTCLQRYDPENTVFPLLQPLGVYEGTAQIHWYYADDMSGKPNYNSAGFKVNIVDRKNVTEGYFQMSEEFPGVEFGFSRYGVSASDEKIKNYNIYSANEIKCIYLADLNNDGKREICSSARFLSSTGIYDERIFVFDYANKKLYELCDIGSYDYRIEAVNIGYEYYLSAEKCDYITGYNLSSEPLSLDIMNEVKKATQVSGSVLESVLKVAYKPAVLEQTYEFRMPEFDGQYFVCDEQSVRTYRWHEPETVLINGGVDELYLADLNGDYKRELVAVLNGGHYFTDGYTEKIYGSIMVYDYANEKLYEKVNDTGFSLEEKDNKLVLYHNYSTPEEPLTLDIMTEITE